VAAPQAAVDESIRAGAPHYAADASTRASRD
jgi:hypothetical protein